MRKLLLLFFLFTLSTCLYAADVNLPKSLRLAGALNATKSQFGDEFYNFPALYQGRARPGSTYQSGRIEFQFSPPVNNTAHFKMFYDGSGTSDGIVFPGGQTYDLLDNRVFNSPLFASEGDLDLKTGKIANFSVHSIFQNSTIARVTKNIRIPFGFVSDYPPTDLPIDRPFTDKPQVSTTAGFHFDSYGNITGFEFAGFSVAPVTLFPRLGIFPPFSFGENGNFYFANPNGCVANAPPQNCLNDQNNPNGILLAANGFFHPHFNLYTDELVEVPASTVTPPCQLKGIAAGNGLVAVNGKLYQVGGFDASDASAMVQVYDPAADSWSFGTSAPLATAGSSAVASGSKIYLINGRIDGDVVTNRIFVYDTSADAWQEFPQATPAGVYEAAAGTVAPTDLSPGSRVVILGFNFADSIYDAPQFRLDNGLTTDLPTTLHGITVRVDGNPAPIIRVSPRQVEFQIPYNIDASASKRRKATLELIKEGSPVQQPAIQIPLLAVGPGIYLYNYNEFRYTRYLDGATAVARNQNGTLVYPNNPAHPGQVITLRMTGLGAVSPKLQNGERAGTTAPQPVLAPTVTIGGLSANIVSASLKTDDIGVYEVQVTVPSNSPTGNNVPVSVTIGGVKSNQAVIAIR